MSRRCRTKVICSAVRSPIVFRPPITRTPRWASGATSMASGAMAAAVRSVMAPTRTSRAARWASTGTWEAPTSPSAPRSAIPRTIAKYRLRQFERQVEELAGRRLCQLPSGQARGRRPGRLHPRQGQCGPGRRWSAPGSRRFPARRTANTSGNLLKVVGTVGYSLGSETLAFTPFVGVDFTTGHLGGFNLHGNGGAFGARRWSGRRRIAPTCWQALSSPRTWAS